MYSIKCLLKWRLVFWVSVTTIQRELVRLADPSESLGTFDIKPCQLAGVFTQDPHRKCRGGEKREKACASICPCMASGHFAGRVSYKIWVGLSDL